MLLSPSLLFLQEIWLPFSAEKQINTILPDFTFQISTPDMFMNTEEKLGRPDHTWHGCAIGWHESLQTFIQNIPATNERFSAVCINFPSCPVLAISVYFPTSGKDDEFMDCISHLSNLIMDHTNENMEILIGTDSNCSEKSSRRRLEAFCNFCNEFSLMKISNNLPTYHSHSGTSESCNDFFLMSSKSKTNLKNIQTICTLSNPINFSSHDVVSASLNVPHAPKEKDNPSKFSQTYSVFDQKRIIWDSSHMEDYQQLCGEMLSKCEESFPDPEYIPLKCQLVSDLLVKSAEIVFESKETQKKPSKPISKRKHQAWQHLMKSFKTWKEGGKIKKNCNSDHRRYKAARANFQCIRRYEENLLTVRENNMIMYTNRNAKNKFFNLMKRLRGQNVRPTTKKLITPLATYYGSDVLEGFTADAELLGRHVGVSTEFDNSFYKLCIEDNIFIFDFKGDDAVTIPEMNIDDLNRILFKDMKSGKSCDIYMLTVEHLRNAGEDAKQCILNLVNEVIRNIYYLTCPQIKKGLSSVIHKGKKKPATISNSYRRITVTPQIGGILDRYIHPVAENIFLDVQSPDQYGFTKDMSYLMGAVERGECQRWALDNKITCFGVSFDGQAAFPSVDRDIQVRELYTVGERGDYLEYSRNTYQNTASQIKIGTNLSREFNEFRGSRQGHKRAAGNFKAYINPCLDAANSSNLGFNIGPHCVSAVCIADDTYVLSDDPRKLQNIINIVAHYGRRYRLIFGAEKTKVTITGSKVDMQYYSDINIWSLNGEKIKVTENNDHLGLVVSGEDEEIKNVDKNIQATRDSMFALLGQAFSYRCKLAPTVQLYIWNTYCKPVLRSGLSALPIRPPIMKTITSFHRTTLRGFLKLSQTSPIAPLYFLMGELPLEANLHMDVLILFWNIWSNPQTKVFDIVKYILMMTDNTSLTWAAHVRILCQTYQLPDPLTLMQGDPWPKEKWKTLINTRITVYHETVLRRKALGNWKLSLLNVQLTGLTGRHHPVLSGLFTTHDVSRLRPHVKMLAGDYTCYATLAIERGTDPQCRLCPATLSCPPPSEDIQHVLLRCRGTADVRTKMIPELLNTVAKFFPRNKILDHHDHLTMIQFILDCSSPNLPSTTRIDPNHINSFEVIRVCRDICYGIHKERIRKLRALGHIVHA